MLSKVTSYGISGLDAYPVTTDVELHNDRQKRRKFQKKRKNNE